MAEKRVPIKWFVEQLIARYKAGDGYIMGSTGQDPSKWSTGSWWFTQYTGSQKEKALYWRSHAKRVWDCNGMAEGLYKDYTGVDINTKARYNYANWCSEKGTGLIPANKRAPGMAVFWGNTAATITHVGYLVEPVVAGNTAGDWYIIEARGVMYGVVKTKLNSRKPKYWGKMDKYFDYGNSAVNPAPSTPAPTPAATTSIKRGMKGAAVVEIQKLLLAWNQGCLPKYNADGDFGAETEKAVKAFQTEKKLSATGIVDDATLKALKNLSAPKQIQVTGSSVNVRSLGSTAGMILRVVHAGDKLIWTEKNSDGWYHLENGWISGKYVKEI